jgi:pyruvate formate-lyase activating enzyme-like uncharacterized protein
VKIYRTCAYIRALKEEFGKGFHIHLYTSFDFATEQSLKMLHDVGLDEIRFHADLDSDALWSRIALAKKFDWDVGVEIPVMPGKQKMTEKLMKFLDKKIDFLNLNELEVSDATANKLSEKGFRTKDSLSYGVKGSELLAKALLAFAVKNNLFYSIHYCTAKLKDAVQLSKRIAKRAKNVKKPYDILNKDGLLTRGAIYFPYLTPSKETSDKLALLLPSKRAMLLKKLEIFRNHLMRTYGIPPALIDIDPTRIRLLTNIKVVSDLNKEIKKSGLRPSIVTEFPTWDALIVELEWV